MTDAASESPDFSNQALFTPAMRQFIDVKNRYPNTLVLFRMGDFYETFFKDAVIANRLIGITLTKRGKLTDGTPIPMAGIPAARHVYRSSGAPGRKRGDRRAKRQYPRR